MINFIHGNNSGRASKKELELQTSLSSPEDEQDLEAEGQRLEPDKVVHKEEAQKESQE